MDLTNVDNMTIIGMVFIFIGLILGIVDFAGGIASGGKLYFLPFTVLLIGIGLGLSFMSIYGVEIVVRCYAGLLIVGLLVCLVLLFFWAKGNRKAK